MKFSVLLYVINCVWKRFEVTVPLPTHLELQTVLYNRILTVLRLASI